IDADLPARDLLPRRRKYFIGVLDPAASIELTRWCPWDCSFCSAWTFYGRSYRRRAPEIIGEKLAQIREPGVFIVYDVDFIQAGQLTTRDYRLFDIQHAVLPTRLPLDRFYEELVRTQQVLNRKHLGLSALKGTAVHAARLLARGQTNFVRMLWRFNSVFNPRR